MLNPMQPNRKQFEKDPAGYSRSAWMRWAMLMALHGGDIDPTLPPTSDDLKDPILWLAQAEAMTQAANVLLRQEPTFDSMPIEIRGICDTQYCAVALMLVGYSLEVCLKAMLIIKEGVSAYAEADAARKYKHHDLKKLAHFMPSLSLKEQAILDLLTHFVYWAGRYPDPGRKDIDKHEAVFELSETHQISARDLFTLAAKVMGHVKTLTS